MYESNADGSISCTGVRLRPFRAAYFIATLLSWPSDVWLFQKQLLLWAAALGVTAKVLPAAVDTAEECLRPQASAPEL